MVKAKKQALGRGLSALMPDKPIFEETSPQQKIVMLPIGKLQADPDQPRQIFDEDKLSELAESIRQFGVMQPLLVTSLDDGSYRIIVGERRFRAAQMRLLMQQAHGGAVFDAQRAGIGRDLARDEPQQRGFARAVRPDEPHALAALQGKG